MEQKSAEEKVKENVNEFWQGATNWELKSKPPCEHHFVHKTAQEVTCQKGCGLTYFINPNFNIDKGHIYKKGKLII